MRTRWVVLVFIGALCAWGRADIILDEYSGYQEGTHYKVEWVDVDPNDPNNPLQPEITIVEDIWGQAFWFRCYDDVTDEPADIHSIIGDPTLYGVVGIKVVDKNGTDPGARDVGFLSCDITKVAAWFSAFQITGTLGTLEEESHIGGIMGPFSVVELGEALHVDSAISQGTLFVTGAGPHYADVTVKSLWGSVDPNDVEIQITGNYLGTMTLGSMG